MFVSFSDVPVEMIEPEVEGICFQRRNSCRSSDHWAIEARYSRPLSSKPAQPHQSTAQQQKTEKIFVSQRTNLTVVFCLDDDNFENPQLPSGADVDENTQP